MTPVRWRPPAQCTYTGWVAGSLTSLREWGGRPVAGSATRAVPVHRLVGRVVDQLEEVGELLFGWLDACGHGDVLVFHPGGLDHIGLAGFAVCLEGDDHLDAELRQVGGISAFGLRAAVVRGVELTEVVDVDAGCDGKGLRTRVRVSDGWRER